MLAAGILFFSYLRTVTAKQYQVHFSYLGGDTGVPLPLMEHTRSKIITYNIAWASIPVSYLCPGFLFMEGRYCCAWYSGTPLPLPLIAPPEEGRDVFGVRIIVEGGQRAVLLRLAAVLGMPVKHHVRLPRPGFHDGAL